jgi:hypothetical protein
MTQCILTGDCIKTVEALDLTTESTVEIVGKVEKVKDGQTAPGGVEIIVDYWKIIGLAPGGKEAFESIIQPVCPITSTRFMADEGRTWTTRNELIYDTWSYEERPQQLVCDSEPCYFDLSENDSTTDESPKSLPHVWSRLPSRVVPPCSNSTTMAPRHT